MPGEKQQHTNTKIYRYGTNGIVGVTRSPAVALAERIWASGVSTEGGGGVLGPSRGSKRGPDFGNLS